MIYEHFVEMLKESPVQRNHSEIFDGFENFVGTKKQIEEEEARLNGLVKAEAVRQRSEHYKHQRGVKEQFKQALFDEYGFGVDAINNKVWDLIYDNSFYDIEAKFQEIIEIAEFSYCNGQLNHDK